MADFSVNPVASQVKPPQAISLGEMLNLARGAQAYQQAQQTNPLEVQKAKAELQRLNQLMPEEYRRAVAEAGRAETEASVAADTAGPRVGLATSQAKTADIGTQEAQLKLDAIKQKKIADSQIAMINNPLVVKAEQNPNAANKEALVNLVKQNGMVIARDLGIPAEEASKLLEPYIQIAANDPGALRQYFKQRHIQGLDDASRTSALTPSGITVNTGTGVQTVNTAPFSEVGIGKTIPGTAGTIVQQPGETVGEDAQGNPVIYSKDTFGNVTVRPVGSSAPFSGGGGVQINPTNAAPPVAPVAPVSQPKPVGPANVVAPKPNAMVRNLPEQTNQPEYSQAVPPRFPVRKAGEMVFNQLPAEKDAYASGQKFVQDVVAQRNTVAPVRNNLEKIMSTTDQLLAKQGFQAGKGLQVEQYLTKLVDDSEYKTLSKNLANLQLSLIGNNPGALSSDAGKQMTAAASGTEVYPPKVLQKIVVQLHGEMENRDRQGIAADKYARRFGEANMPSFTQMWSNNADNKVFELMSLPKLIKDPKMRAEMANEIIGYPKGSEKRKEFEQKYLNIQKLIKDGTL